MMTYPKRLTQTEAMKLARKIDATVRFSHREFGGRGFTFIGRDAGEIFFGLDPVYGFNVAVERGRFSTAKAPGGFLFRSYEAIRGA
jgi:hypothetical protein